MFFKDNPYVLHTVLTLWMAQGSQLVPAINEPWLYVWPLYVAELLSAGTITLQHPRFLYPATLSDVSQERPEIIWRSIEDLGIRLCLKRLQHRHKEKPHKAWIRRNDGAHRPSMTILLLRTRHAWSNSYVSRTKTISINNLSLIALVPYLYLISPLSIPRVFTSLNRTQYKSDETFL